MKIVFMGTPHFAVPSLKELLKHFEVEAVFTQPDKQRGRGKKVTFSPIKDVAIENDIKVYQPRILRKDRETIDELKAMEPDFIVVVAYGQILSKEVLDIPKYGCVNLHASLLPKYRGAAPLNWAIIEGEKVSGSTTQLMDIGVDTGDMLLKQEVELGDEMTVSELHDILSEGGGDLLVRTLKGMVSGEVVGEAQNHELSTHAPKLDKEIARIKWDKSGKDIKNLVRGLNAYPCAITGYMDKNIKVYECDFSVSSASGELGEILSVTDKGVEVKCGDGVVSIKKLQFPGKKPMMVSDYIRGNKIETGVILK